MQRGEKLSDELDTRGDDSESCDGQRRGYGRGRGRSLQVKWIVRRLVVMLALAAFVASAVAFGASSRTLAAEPCSTSVGPGIPAPTGLRYGYEGFHAAYYGQSGYPTLCPGDRITAVVAFYNTGTRGWIAGRMGEVAYLGTWNPVPGQDQPSVLGGDGKSGSPNTGWPRFNRIATQPVYWVGPGQVAWFQFTIQAPAAPGSYRLHLRPLIEGAQWLEDFGIYWPVTVLPAVPPAPTPNFGAGRKLVGTDIQPGTYRTRSANGACYWERLSGLGGTPAEIIVNQFTSDVDVVTVAAGDRAFNSSGCAQWTSDLSAISLGQTQPFGAGTYIVGVDVAPGTWRAAGATPACYWQRTAGFSHEFADVLANEVGNTAPVVTIGPTDKGFASTACGTWTRAP